MSQRSDSISQQSKNNLHFIKAPCHQSNREQGYQFAPDHIKEKYDYEIDRKLFDDSVIGYTDTEIKLCPGYELLYKYIEANLNDFPHKIITIGGDHSISAGTIPAINEKHPDLVILWIDSCPDIHDFTTSESKNLNEMPGASILGLCGNKFTNSKLNISPDQIIYFGLNEDDDQIDFVRNSQMVYFTSKKINTLNKENPDTIINAIKGIVGNRPVHISLDMKVFHKDIVKCVIPTNDKGLMPTDIERLLVGVKENIVSMDICEFNPLIGTPNDIRVTKELIRYLLTKTFDIKEKSINIFTEDSQFLIYRPLEQEDPETDIGWYILRGCDIEMKEFLLNKIQGNEIISVDIDDDTFLVTKTNMTEQNEMSYYGAHSISDTALFPQEKALMMFELVNT